MIYETECIDAKTGKIYMRPWTPEQIAAYEAEKNKLVVPASITPRQCRLLLLQQNFLGEVEALISQSTEDIKITWEYALEFRRDDPLLNQLATNLNLTQVQIDQFFIAAAQL